MSDYRRLAHQFITNAVELKSGEKIWLECTGAKAQPLADACLEEVRALGADAHYIMRDSGFINSTLLTATDDDLQKLGDADLAIMKTMQGYIRIGDVGDKNNIKASLDDQQRLSKALRPALSHRVDNTRWLVVRAPTDDFAKACGMDFPQFQKFYEDACLFDYSRMYKPAEILADVMTKGRQVEIRGKDTHLKFSIEGIGAKECIGKRNIPDGECYSAPVKGSVEGTVLFGPSVYMGKSFSQIYLIYEGGKVIDARGGNNEETANLNLILNSDEGARYPGEFSLAFHPQISEPVGDVLFDEKIRGSWHFANGTAYKGITDNGNVSSIHWDKVQIQRPEHGGGEIRIDNRLIRKDGLFVVPELEGLNPARLCGPA